MNNRIFATIILLMTLSVNMSYAAFPVSHQNKIQTLPVERNTINFPDNAVTKPTTTNQRNNTQNAAIGFSIAAFVCGLVGLIVAGIPLGICAIVFGVIGMSKSFRGLAIAGIILGIIDVIGVLLYLSQHS